MSDEAGSALEQADVDLARAAGEWREHPFVKLAGAASEATDQLPLALLCGGVIAGGLATGDRALAHTGARALAAHLLAAAIKWSVKRLVDRTRPFVLLDDDHYEVRPAERHDKPYNSFPSGHTAGAVAVARAWARDRPDEAGVAYALAAAAGLIQIPRAMHYPIDVVAGALVGIGAEALVDRATRRLMRDATLGPR